LSQMQELAAKLVVDDLRDIDSESSVSQETNDRCGHRPVLFGRGLYNLRENVAVEEKWTRH
jgi:hypothetical protein